MLFIKNLTSLESSKIRVALHQNKEDTQVSLTVDKCPELIVLQTKVNGICESILRSINHIGNTTNQLVTEDNVTGTCLMDKKITEINFGMKGTRTVLKSTKELPATIDVYETDGEAKEHFPRDLVIFILPKKVDGVEKSHRLIIDRRNLSSPIITKDLGEYRIIAMSVKWAIWGKLKFPAYAYIKDNNNNVVGAFKLGFRVDNKISKNVLLEVDNNEAVDYLTESFRLLKEKRGEFDKKPFSKKFNNGNNGQGKRPFNADRRNNDSRSLHSKYKNR